MRASVSKNVAAIKAASIEIGSRIEEAEDIEAAVKLCEKLTEACRLDHEAGFQILRPLRMPTGFLNVRLIDGATGHCCGGICNFEGRAVTPIGISSSIRFQEFLDGGKFDRVQLLPTVDKGVIELRIICTPKT